MRRNMLQARSLAATHDYIPHDILRDAFPPHLSRPGDGSKDPSLRDPGCCRPLIERRLYPSWNRHGADVATLADQSTTAQCPWRTWISSNSKPTSSDLRKPQPSSNGQHRVFSLGTHAIATSVFENFGALLCTQPVAGSKTELLDTLHSADARSQLGTQQT